MKTKDLLGREWDISCMGCAISEGSMLVPGDFIVKTQHFCVHQDPLIPLPGFLVIASRRHIQSITEMQEQEYREFSSLLQAAAGAIKAVTGVGQLTIVQEESSIHFHLWFFPWTQSVTTNHGRPSLSTIREIMSDLRRQPITEGQWKELAESITGIREYWLRTYSL